MDFYQYKFVAREVEINETIRGKMIDRKTIQICLADEKSGLIIPHPLTDFIKQTYEYNGKSLNTMSLPANRICKFLNFCISKIREEDREFISLKEEGIRGLTRLHGSRYISQLTMNGLQKDTVIQYERYLSKFYLYLKKMEWIDEEFSTDYYTNTKGEIIHTSLFREPHLPTRLPSLETSKRKPVKTKDFGEHRIELATHFIRIAQDIEPDIALGLCFQFFGGLRCGEVVNIGRSGLNIQYRESMEVVIQDNRKKFFKRLKNTTKENPKRLNYLNQEMCRQTILDNDLVWEIYDQHMKRLDILYKKGHCRIVEALFFDDAGYPMSGQVFENRFANVKKAFLNSLVGHETYDYLSNSTWSTHIGRGVFTNILIDMGFTPTKLAIARGDRNVNSAMAYIDERQSQQHINEAINSFKDYEEEDIGVILSDDIKKWKEKGEISHAK